MTRESRAQSTTLPLRRRRREPPAAPEIVAVGAAPPSVGQIGRLYRQEAARWLCRMVVRAFGLLYLVALAFTGISATGWFDFAPAPLAGVFLVVIGLPWTLAAAWFPDPLQPLVAAAAPLVTLILLWSYCHWPRRRD
jgi:hypothetical protein